MIYADARRLGKGDYVLIHTSEVIFSRVKRWVRARVVSVKYNKLRPEVPDIRNPHSGFQEAMAV